MKTFLIIIGIFATIITFSVLHFACSYAGEAVDVARAEFSPQQLLNKYAWFKDAAAQLDAKNATISRLRNQISSIESNYTNVSRGQWPREDRQTLNVWQSDLSGAIGSFNLLAAEYNAQMAKFNYAFTNIGSLPAGASKPLPREFKPYTEQ